MLQNSGIMRIGTEIEHAMWRRLWARYLDRQSSVDSVLWMVKARSSKGQLTFRSKARADNTKFGSSVAHTRLKCVHQVKLKAR
jgi:hypothetical protein